MMQRNRKSLVYRIFLFMLLVGMHAEYQFGSFHLFGSNMQYSSVEFVIGFATLFLCAYILFERISPKELFKEKALFLILLSFCLSLILSTVFARYKVEAVKYDIRIIATLVLFYLLMEFLFKERLKEYSVFILQIVGIVVSLVCILKYLNIDWVKHVCSHWGFGSQAVFAASVFQHNNVFGNWLVLLIFIVLGQSKEIGSAKSRICLWSTTVLLVVTLPMALSRSAWVAFIVSLSVYLWIKRKDIKPIITTTIVLLALLTMVVVIPQAQEKLKQTKYQLLYFNKLIKNPGSRYNMYKTSLRIFKAHPLVGIGLNNYKNVLFQYIGSPKRYESFDGKWNAHNQYLNILAEQGLFGFIVFMIFVAYLVRLAISNIKKGGNEFYALAIFAYLIGEMFDYLWYDYSFIFMFWFVVILNIIEKRELERRDLGISKLEN